MIENSVFSTIIGLIEEMLFMLISICNGLSISKYKAHWLTDFQVIYNPKRILVIFWSGIHYL